MPRILRENAPNRRNVQGTESLRVELGFAWPGTPLVITMMTRYGVITMMTRYAPTDMAMDQAARAPDPGALADYAGSYTNADHLASTDPLAMLRLGQAMRVALRAYDEQCVYAARMAGATWEEIGNAMGMARQNAQRKYSHLPEPS